MIKRRVVYHTGAVKFVLLWTNNDSFGQPHKISAVVADNLYCDKNLYSDRISVLGAQAEINKLTTTNKTRIVIPFPSPYAFREKVAFTI